MLIDCEELVVLIVNSDRQAHYFLRETVFSIRISCIVKSIYNGADFINYFRRSGSFYGAIDEKPDIILLSNNLTDLSATEIVFELRNDAGIADASVYIFDDRDMFLDLKSSGHIKIKGRYAMATGASKRIQFLARQIVLRHKKLSSR